METMSGSPPCRPLRAGVFTLGFESGTWVELEVPVRERAGGGSDHEDPSAHH